MAIIQFQARALVANISTLIQGRPIQGMRPMTALMKLGIISAGSPDTSAPTTVLYLTERKTFERGQLPTMHIDGLPLGAETISRMI